MQKAKKLEKKKKKDKSGLTDEERRRKKEEKKKKQKKANESEQRARRGSDAYEAGTLIPAEEQPRRRWLCSAEYERRSAWPHSRSSSDGTSLARPPPVVNSNLWADEPEAAPGCFFGNRARATDV